MPRTSTTGIDYTSKDYEAFRNMMLKALDIKMPEYTDRRQSDAGIVILELNAQALDIISYYQDIIANEAFLATEEQRSNALKWCKMLGYTPRAATPAKFKQVFKLSSIQPTDTLIPQGTIVKTVGSTSEAEVRFETESDLIIPAGKLGDELDSNNEYMYTVTVVQGTSVEGEMLGSSTGVASQEFTLNYTPVIVDSVAIVINEGSGFERWTRVDSFTDSTPTSRHYMVTISDNDEAVITFGDGVFGKIPAKFTNGIYCNYRVGGGTNGNVSANKITVLGSNLALVSTTFNPDLAYEEGFDKETLEEIKVNAPIAYRTLWGALTLDDFSGVIKANFPQVQYAAAEVVKEDPDNIRIYLYLYDEKPLTQALKDEILLSFDENEGGRKIVGAKDILLEYAVFVPVDLECVLVVKDRYSRATVEGEVKNFLEYYFKKGNYPFNQELSFSELVADIMSPNNGINGIKSFKFLTDVDIMAPALGEIFTLNSLTFNTTGGVE